jgi:hypothetical protein
MPARSQLDALQDAVASGDPNKATGPTQELTTIIAEIQAIKANQDTNKLFGGAPRVSGTHNVTRKFAERAGVRAA